MPVLATLIQLRAGGLVIGPDPFFNSQIEQLAALVLHHTVPAVYEWRRIGLAPPMLLTSLDISRQAANLSQTKRDQLGSAPKLDRF
jgi:putative ABC transport system substrate-binding protein